LRFARGLLRFRGCRFLAAAFFIASSRRTSWPPAFSLLLAFFAAIDESSNLL